MNTGLPVGFSIQSIVESWNSGELLESTAASLAFLLWQTIARLIGVYLPVEFAFNKVYGFPKEVAEAYSMPFPSSLYRAGPAKLPLLALTEKVNSSLQETRDFLKRWKKPALVMFSDCDPITRGRGKLFLSLIPHAEYKEVFGGGHFLQEEIGEELAENIISFITSGGATR